MSFDPVINVANLGKCYPIFDSPRDRLKQMFMRGRKKYYREFWALRDISFKVQKGEAWGIIGRNGSGKSTLLQLICGTLSCTEGEIVVNAKIAALLELGAGFNPEFTGVENIYMACSLYGMSREEIDLKFNDIIDFAGIGDHLVQPVKTYSSGMYVRLGFAVIAHVNADVLIIDEALAVGDAIFTQKCMSFIRDFKSRGTLIFVSHDMGAVLSLCDKAVWLDSGRLRLVGGAREVSEAYLHYTHEQIYGAPLTEIQVEKPAAGIQPEQDESSGISIVNNLPAAKGWTTGSGKIVHVEFQSAKSKNGTNIQGGEKVTLIVRAEVGEHMTSPILGFLVRDRLGQDLFGENTLNVTSKPKDVSQGQLIEARFVFNMPYLPNGEYSVLTSLAEGTLHNHVQHYWLHNSLILNVLDAEVRYGLIGLKCDAIEFECIS